ncbi:MAG: hypothetical protein IJN03_01190 [Bacilli bacterium]|nr:hypothetical protein [Bacilli bacterium]
MRKDTKTIFLSIIAVLLLIAVGVGISYAYFQIQKDVDKGKVTVEAETDTAAEIDYTTGQDINLDLAEPGDSDSTEFNIALTASNKAADKITYGIDWIITKNEFVYEPEYPGMAQLVYSLYYSFDQNNWTPFIENADCTDLGKEATTSNPFTHTIASNQELSANANTTKTIYWKFVLEYKAYDFNQATNMSKTFNGKIKVTGI